MSQRLRRLQKKNISEKKPMSNTGVGHKVVGKWGKIKKRRELRRN